MQASRTGSCDRRHNWKKTNRRRRWRL